LKIQNPIEGSGFFWLCEFGYESMIGEIVGYIMQFLLNIVGCIMQNMCKFVGCIMQKG